MIINRYKLLKFNLYFIILAYVLSVSRFCVVELDNKLYFLKHAVILIPAIIIFFEWRFIKNLKLLKGNVFYVLILAFILSPFFLRGIFNISELVIFFQLALFLFSCTFFARYLENIMILFNKSDFYILIAIFFIPLVLNLVFESGDFIYNTYYGRPRLLIGYFHPKEGAICLLTVIIFYHLLFIKYYSFKSRFFHILFFFALLYFMQSRNILIYYFNFLILQNTLKRVSINAILFVYFVLPLIVISVLVYLFYDQINLILSDRLDVWLENFSFTVFGRGSSIADYSKTNVLSKIHFDNYYLEYLVENGIFFFSILVLLLYRICVGIAKFKIGSIYINAFFISFLFFCIFDAGMFSSGNLLNFLVWVIVFAFLYKRRNLFETL
jgi:hypothetical protein